MLFVRRSSAAMIVAAVGWIVSRAAAAISTLDETRLKPVSIDALTEMLAAGTDQLDGGVVDARPAKRDGDGGIDLVGKEPRGLSEGACECGSRLRRRPGRVEMNGRGKARHGVIRDRKPVRKEPQPMVADGRGRPHQAAEFGIGESTSADRPQFGPFEHLRAKPLQCRRTSSLNHNVRRRLEKVPLTGRTRTAREDSAETIRGT